MKTRTAVNSNPVNPENSPETKGVKILEGDPKKAIIKLAVPMIVAMSVQTLYQLIDTFWVSGLGADALAAMGFVFPFFFISMALSNGLGIGGGAAISRKIGARDKVGADNVAVHTIIMMLLLVLIFTIPFYVFAPQIFSLAGAGRTTDLAVAYARVIFLGSIVIFFTNVANSILRAEGDSNRAMKAMIYGAVLNIVLDPIFIYTFKMGIAGAAWATLLSLAVSSVMMLNWLFFRKDTFVSFDFKDFSFERNIVNDIFRITIPASAQQLSMSLSMLVINLIIVNVSNTDGAAGVSHLFSSNYSGFIYWCRLLKTDLKTFLGGLVYLKMFLNMLCFSFPMCRFSFLLLFGGVVF